MRVNERSPIHRHALYNAERSAVRLIAYASTIFPDLDKGFGDILFDDIADNAVSFAINARRCLEIEDLDADIVATRWEYEKNPKRIYETKLRRALNGIVHAREVAISFNNAPMEIFVDHANNVCLHISYETDRYPKTYVDIFGMCWAFLTIVRDKNYAD